VHGFCVHLLGATTATNALAHNTDIAKVQEWLGHVNVSTTQIYDKQRMRPEESPLFKEVYAGGRKSDRQRLASLLSRVKQLPIIYRSATILAMGYCDYQDAST
jgi:hypothetical protein